jgi:hypothetical protein
VVVARKLDQVGLLKKHPHMRPPPVPLPGERALPPGSFGHCMQQLRLFSPGAAAWYLARTGRVYRTE